MNRVKEYFDGVVECACSSLSWRYRWVCVVDNLNPHRTLVDIDPEDGEEYTTKEAYPGMRWLCHLHDDVIERGFQKLYPEDYGE